MDLQRRRDLLRGFGLIGRSPDVAFSMGTISLSPYGSWASCYGIRSGMPSYAPGLNEAVASDNLRSCSTPPIASDSVANVATARRGNRDRSSSSRGPLWARWSTRKVQSDIAHHGRRASRLHASSHSLSSSSSQSPRTKVVTSIASPSVHCMRSSRTRSRISRPQVKSGRVCAVVPPRDDSRVRPLRSGAASLREQAASRAQERHDAIAGCARARRCWILAAAGVQ